MSKNNNNSSQKFSLGVIIGVILGAVAGLLTAPQSGKETRGDIKKKAKEARGTAERKLKVAYKELNKISGDLKVKSKDLTGKAKDEADGLGKQAEQLKQRVKLAITVMKQGEDGDEAKLDDILDEVKKFAKTVQSRAKTAVKTVKNG